MRRPPPDAERMWFVEEFERTWVRGGGSSSEGRVLGLLLVTQRAALCSTDLQVDLGISAGTVSTVTRRLVALGLIERRRVPGDRRHFYAAGDDVWGSFLAGERPLLDAQRDLADRGLRDLDLGADEKARVRLANMAAYMTWVAARHRRLHDEWAAHRDEVAGSNPR